MTPEDIYLSNLSTIDRIAAHIAHRSHVSADQVSEFVQEVRLRLLENDYAIIQKFEGRSSLSTYLTTVITRLFGEYRIEQWGRWRPSAEARRLGDKAMVLERLITRDGYTFDEAVKVLTTPSGSQYTLAELETIYLRLPLRTPRPVHVSEDASVAVAVESDADDRVERSDQECAVRKTNEAMDRLMESMDSEDRLILEMRFWHALTVPDIARRLHVDQKRLYKRLGKICGTMRAKLEAEGIRGSEVNAMLARGDQELHFGVLSGGNKAVRHSHAVAGEVVEGGEDRLR